jgi:hypothetical protein
MRGEVAMRESSAKAGINRINRRHFIGGSDARVIMGNDEQALIRLWREKRGEVEPQDLSENLVVQLGLDRRTQSPLVRSQYRAGHHRHPKESASSGAALDGSDSGWPD